MNEQAEARKKSLDRRPRGISEWKARLEVQGSVDKELFIATSVNGLSVIMLKAIKRYGISQEFLFTKIHILQQCPESLWRVYKLK